VVKVIKQKAASHQHTNHAIICSLKTFCLNGFTIIKQFLHPYSLPVLFLEITANAGCHWLKRDVVAVRPCVAYSFHALSCYLKRKNSEF